MQNPLMQTIEALAKEKGIEADVVIGAIEDAVLTASRKYYKTNENLKTRFNQDTGQVDLFAVKQIVREVANPATEISLEEAQQLYGDEAEVDMEIEFPKPTEVLGRIAAQTAKQVIFQKLRDAEREMTYEEFAGREGDVVTGIVQQSERRYTLLDLGKVEALLPQAEQVPTEPLRNGERLKAFIVEVRKGVKGPQIVVSRSHPGLLKALFAMEVPEIDEGIVEIRAVAREPGHRSKIAVWSNEPAVDPVGACVGPKGSRVRMVVNELRGEKIDVVPWSSDTPEFVAHALQPAKVKEVSVDPDTMTANVIVPDYQLSLAIGKEGQNARLAARLTGCRIDIKSETQASAPPPPPAKEEPVAEPAMQEPTTEEPVAVVPTVAEAVPEEAPAEG
jgi:N utilization substance protein A